MENPLNAIQEYGGPEFTLLIAGPPAAISIKNDSSRLDGTYKFDPET